MAALTRAHAGLRDRVVAAGESFLKVYAQIVFSRSPAVGLLLLLASAVAPRALIAGAVAVLVATATAILLDLDRDAIKGGDYQYSALLVGLGVGMGHSGFAGVALLLVLTAAISVLVTAALRAWLGASGLPVMSIPFVLTLILALGAAGLFGAEPRAVPHDASALSSALPSGVVLFVRSLGGLFYLPRLDAGAFVLAALALHSRIALSLAASAFTVVLWLSPRAAGVPVEALGINAMLAAMALGGVYFVPSTSSFLLALAGAVLAVLGAVGLAPVFAKAGVPLSILPFNVAVLVMLFALRQRVRDVHPKSVDFLPGTPEENLAYFRTRRSRFEEIHPVAFQLPVRGAWTVTQAEDGDVTHQGPWRHAFDFEVRDEEGQFAEGDGGAVGQYHCFRLPVLAAAEGTVVAVEDGIVDNAVGEMNLDENWGNHVIVQHGVGLYSLVAHLACGSVKVQKGQFVRRGDVLGLTGSSGRSPRPHLHFQLQATAELGAPTVPCRFTDVVMESGGGPHVVTSCAPALGDVVRNLSPSQEVSAYLDWELGSRMTFEVRGERERLIDEVDLFGRRLLRSEDRGASLFYGRGESAFVSYDAVGEAESVVHLIRAALPRVLFEAAPDVAFVDQLPARPFRPWVGRALLDLVSPFLARDGIETRLRMRRDGAMLVIEGESRRKNRRGEPLLRTRAVLARSLGPVRVEVTVRGKTTMAERVMPEGE
jgi:murein DD-endopeptidase MepM/ murein hydrolase activator NlpD